MKLLQQELGGLVTALLSVIVSCGEESSGDGAAGRAGTGGRAGAGGSAGAAARAGQAGADASTPDGAGGSLGGTGGASADAGGSGGKSTAPCAPDPGRQPNAQLAALADNAALDLGRFPCTVPDSDDYACTQVTDYSGLVYDCKGHRLLMFGGGHATTFTDTIFSFDFGTLTWTELYPPTPCTSAVMSASNFDRQNAMWRTGPAGPYPRPISRHTYDLLAYVDTLDELLILVGPNGDSASCPPGSTGYTFAATEATVAHYDLGAGSWSSSTMSAGNGSLGTEYPASEPDPVSGKIIVLGRYGLYIYDPVQKTRSVALDDYNGNVFDEDLGYANHLTYFPPNDRFYYFDRTSGAVWELALDRADFSKSTVTKQTVSGTGPSGGEPGFDYDSKHQIIGGAVRSGRFFAFDPAAKAWQSASMTGATAESQAFHAIAYDPVNNMFVFLSEGRRTWAYRYRR